MRNLIVPILMLPILAAGCAASLNDLRATHAGFEVELQETGNNGGRACAPVAFGMAEAAHAFAGIEFAQGDVLRAQQHMGDARTYLDVAKVASTGCADNGAVAAAVTPIETAPPPISPFDTSESTDTDGDGLVDAADRCPNKIEDMDGYLDEDGCPDEDNDGDGIPDVTDGCPNQPEDLDGTADTDGCIDPDDDGDGIADVNDLCPNAPETVNGLDDLDGCPDEALSRVRMERNQILLVEPILFQGTTAEIDMKCSLVLSELSVLMESHPNMRIRVEGHIDNTMDEPTNKTVTDGRANKVREWLNGQGVDATRMEAIGYGSTMPIDTNRTPEGRAKNIRIEIYIIN